LKVTPHLLGHRPLRRVLALGRDSSNDASRHGPIVILAALGHAGSEGDLRQLRRVLIIAFLLRRATDRTTHSKLRSRPTVSRDSAAGAAEHQQRP
jgi:hypothetical protein